ncbi:CNH domain-containing protein [Mycena sanguinolenta]|nr:CNH domain-containing protein [Mycena sanguinolenta]
MAMAPLVAITLSEGVFKPNQVNCAAVYNDGRILYGTGEGVYLHEMKKDPVKVLALNVDQVDVLEDYQLLIVLSEREVLTFPLNALDSQDPTAGLKHATCISKDTSFFKAGFCLHRVLVSTVKTSKLSAVIKVLEPQETTKKLPGQSTTLKVFKEFYLPSEVASIHYLKTRLCVAYPHGFEAVDLEKLETQKLLDPSDEALNFLAEKPPLSFLPWQHQAPPPCPIAIYRIHGEFLLCYDKFAFYMNLSGKRARSEFLIAWEGQPTAFALRWPYVLAFSPSFVEIRNIESGVVRQNIPGSNIRLLFANIPPSVEASGGGNLTDEGQQLDQLRQGSDQILMASEDRILSVRLAENLQS